jgi:hypothetical protein
VHCPHFGQETSQSPVLSHGNCRQHGKIGADTAYLGQDSPLLAGKQ